MATPMNKVQDVPRASMKGGRKGSTTKGPVKFERVPWTNEWMERFHEVSLKIMESNQFTAFMTVLTLYALFGDDMKLCLTDSRADQGFWIMASLCIVFFFSEIVFQTMAYPWYFLGFYFWIDLVSTLSIFTEIPAVMDEMSAALGGTGGKSAAMLKAGKAGRVGTKASKIIRIVRLVRMIRVVIETARGRADITSAFRVYPLHMQDKIHTQLTLSPPPRPVHLREQKISTTPRFSGRALLCSFLYSH